MAQATREISLAYGGTTIGGASTKYHLTGAYRLELDNAQGALEVDVLVTAESVADFTAFEAIWRDVRVTATLTYLGSTLVSWNHSSGSGGVNTRASCSIPGTEEADAGLSRLYRVRIESEQADVTVAGKYRGASYSSDSSSPQAREFNRP